MAERKNPFLDTATTMGKLFGFFSVSLLCGVLVAGLMVPVVAATSSAATTSISAVGELPNELKIDAPAQGTRILAADGSLIANMYFQNRTPVNLDQMSPYIKNAVVAIEDERFYQHGGVDGTGLVRAVVASAFGQRQGASTITQQYVNNVIFQTLEAQGRSDEIRLGAAKGVADKIREIKLAVSLEEQYSKEDILKGYLNIVNFANGSYGVQAAAQYYFQIDAKDLTLAQSALLAGIVNSPSYYDPVRNPDNAQARRDEVLGKMLQQGMIQQAEYDAAIAEPITVTQNPAPNGCMASATAPFFCDYVSNVILNDSAYGATQEDRQQLLLQGGLTITTTLDSGAQAKAQEQVNNTIPAAELAETSRGAAITSIEPGTGKVRAMAQNFQMSPQQAPGQTSYNFNVPKIDEEGNSLGGLGTMQVGSTMKPFTFASWLDAGKSMNTVVDGTRRDYPMSFRWTNSCGTTSSNFTGTNILQNDGDRNYRSMSVLQGLTSSVNTITFASAAQLDFCNIQKMTEAAGLRDGETGDPINFNEAAMLLGSTGIAPLTMANSFATFANNGTYCTPIVLESVKTPSGEELPVPQSECTQTIKSEVANGVMYGLKEVVTRGSGALVRPTINSSYDIGVKTGTTNYGIDTWMVGTTSGLATASWFGSPTGSLAEEYRNQRININGQYYAQLDGSQIAGTAFSNYMNAIAPGYNTDLFPAPPQEMINGRSSQQNNNNNSVRPPSTNNATPLPVAPPASAPPVNSAPPAAPPAPGGNNSRDGGAGGSNP